MRVATAPIQNGEAVGDHDLFSSECWCEPQVKYLDDTGMPLACGPLIKHCDKNHVGNWGVFTDEPEA